MIILNINLNSNQLNSVLCLLICWFNSTNANLKVSTNTQQQNTKHKVTQLWSFIIGI
jgi:hypothetical protein